MNEELKPCPICGQSGGWLSIAPVMDGTTIAVGCKHCSCQVRAPISNEDYAVRLWNTRTEPAWISVEERLPTEEDAVNGRVVVIWEDDGSYDIWNYEAIYDWNSHDFCKITHWTHLPKPPKERKEE